VTESILRTLGMEAAFGTWNLPHPPCMHKLGQSPAPLARRCHPPIPASKPPRRTKVRPVPVIPLPSHRSPAMMSTRLRQRQWWTRPSGRSICARHWIISLPSIRKCRPPSRPSSSPWAAPCSAQALSHASVARHSCSTPHRLSELLLLPLEKVA
jgi:hypothetical protein